jgi:hypothetical protein
VLAAGDQVFAVTFTAAVPATAPAEAVTLVDPNETPVTKPPVTVATDGAAVDHVALPVRFCVLPSE